MPAGWTLLSTYSLVTDTSGPNESWTVSAGPTFTAPNSSAQIPFNKLDNDFYMQFSAVPTAPASSPFTVVVTDSNGVSRSKTISINVNAVTPGSITPSTWRELFQ